MTDGQLRDSELGSEGECEVRCLPVNAAEAARASVTAEGREVVTFTCSISGRSEHAVLIGGRLAEELADRQPQVASAPGARVLASLERATLCACDIATLLGVSQRDVERDLRELDASGLVRARRVSGMQLYALTGAGRQALDTLDDGR